MEESVYMRNCVGLVRKKRINGVFQFNFIYVAPNHNSSCHEDITISTSMVMVMVMVMSWSEGSGLFNLTVEQKLGVLEDT